MSNSNISNKRIKFMINHINKMKEALYSERLRNPSLPAKPVELMISGFVLSYNNGYIKNDEIRGLFMELIKQYDLDDGPDLTNFVPSSESKCIVGNITDIFEKKCKISNNLISNNLISNNKPNFPVKRKTKVLFRRRTNDECKPKLPTGCSHLSPIYVGGSINTEQEANAFWDSFNKDTYYFDKDGKWNSMWNDE